MKYTVRESQPDDEIVIIRINRPEVLNALDKEVAAELYAVFRTVDRIGDYSLT